MNEFDLRRADLNLLVVFEVLMAERNVTRAAERLGRTQSAVSHALARLREQLGDALLVKAGGAMRPTSYALDLAERVKPLLRGIERVLGPRQTFDHATTERIFRLALPDIAIDLFPRLFARMRAQAPGVAFEWVPPRESTLLEVAEGHVDAALVPQALRRPDGVDAIHVGDLRMACFMRKGHPALSRWGVKAWSKWPHVAVGVGDRLRNPISDAAGASGVTRRIAVHVPNFAAVAPLLASSDLLTTLPTVVMTDAVDTFGLAAVRVPIPIEPMPHVVAWSARLTRDPASLWVRACLREVMDDLMRAASRLG
jgi:DNA-binding transcriptional LysR family regulator